MKHLDEALRRWWQRHALPLPTPTAPLLVAFSGGVDSTALLQLAHQTWPGAVEAVHVNHGLQQAAPAFETHCRLACAQWGVPLQVQPVAVTVRTGDSLEEQARHARYRALSEVARQRGACAVWLAQHADDQAETVLLALSRGAGVNGLAAMGERVVHHGVVFGRPWLGVEQSVLRACVAAGGWPWVDDPSNAHTRFTRNRIRHDVMPVLLKAFPAMAQTLARSARHCAEAGGLLAELAQQDLAQVGSPPRVVALQALSAARLANVLRHWLVQVAGRAPSTVQLDELVKQLGAARTRGHQIHLKVANGHVRRVGDWLEFLPPPMAEALAPAGLDLFPPG